MAKQPVVGLGDISFDPSLQTDEVDHDFFDNPAAVVVDEPEPESHVFIPDAVSNGINGRQNSESVFRRGLVGYPLEPINVITDPYPSNLNDSHQVFSTGSLLACLNSTTNDFVPKICTNSCDDDQGFEGESESTNGISSQRQVPPGQRLKLFDISDSSSDESGNESDQELNNFLEKYYDLLDVDDTDNSDFTEVSPMSSLTVSPLPASGDTGEGEDSNHAYTETATEKSAQQAHNEAHNHNPSMETIIIQRTKDQLEDQMPFMISQLPNQFPAVISNVATAEVPAGSATSNNLRAEDIKDLNRNGDRSPSVSSCTSTQNSSSSMSVSSVSSKRSGSSTASSSSCSTSGRKSGRNYTFTPDQLKRIERENNILLKKIIDTQRHGHHHTHSHHGYRSSHRTGAHRNTQCSASIARQRQQRKIDHENLVSQKKKHFSMRRVPELLSYNLNYYFI